MEPLRGTIFKRGKIGLTKPIAVGGGGGCSGHTVFRRGAAPEKIRIVPFCKLRVNSLKATTAGELARAG